MFVSAFIFSPGLDLQRIPSICCTGLIAFRSHSFVFRCISSWRSPPFFLVERHIHEPSLFSSSIASLPLTYWYDINARPLSFQSFDIHYTDAILLTCLRISFSLTSYLRIFYSSLHNTSNTTFVETYVVLLLSPLVPPLLLLRVCVFLVV